MSSFQRDHTFTKNCLLLVVNNCIDIIYATALKSSAPNLYFTFYRDISEASKKVGNNSMSCLSPTCCLTFRKSFASKQFFIIIAQTTEYFNQHFSWLFIRSRRSKNLSLYLHKIIKVFYNPNIKVNMFISPLLGASCELQ